MKTFQLQLTLEITLTSGAQRGADGFRGRRKGPPGRHSPRLVPRIAVASPTVLPVLRVAFAAHFTPAGCPPRSLAPLARPRPQPRAVPGPSERPRRPAARLSFVRALFSVPLQPPGRFHCCYRFEIKGFADRGK